MKRVRCKTVDQINLIGFLYEKENSDIWTLIFPGVDGNIITNEFIDVLGNNISAEYSNFLCCHTRGSFQIISSNGLKKNDIGKTIGSMFEMFDDSKLDILAWLNFSITNGAKKINIIAHSHGSNKVINFFSKETSYDNYINKFIFLSPLDLRTRMNSRREIKELISKAKNKDNFISCGFFYKNSQSFLDMMNNPNLDNFPLMSKENNDFSDFNKIKKEKFIIYGDEENKYFDNIKCKKQFFDLSILKAFIILPNANHIYQEVENQLSNVVIKILINKLNDIESVL